MSSFSQHNNQSYQRLSLSHITQEKSLSISLAYWLYQYPEHYWIDINEYYYIKSQIDQIFPNDDDIKEDDGWLPNHPTFVLPKVNHNNDRKDTRIPVEIKDSNNIKIYTDYDVIKNELKDFLTKDITIVDNKDDADFLFLTDNIKDFLKIDKLVNQFPFEGGLVRKDLLPLTVRGFCFDKDNKAPFWWLPCYDLSTEFHILAIEFKRRQKFGLSNKWIIKPSQGARGIGHVVVDGNDDGLRGIANAAPLLKCFDNPNSETNKSVNDRIAQLLVDKPLTVNGYKFDLRVFVICRSFVPFDVYVHTFYYARLANKLYDETKVKDNEIMLTVNCYSEDEDIAKQQKRMSKEELKTILESENQGLCWDACIDNMHTLLYEFFNSVSSSIGSWPNSRAYYAVDIIFDHSTDIPNPYLVEVNYVGDWHGVQNAVEKVSDYHEWCNDILHSLVIKDELDENKFRKL